MSPCSIRGSDRFQTASNEAYNVVRQTGRTTEGDYEVPNHPSASSQPATTAPADTTAVASYPGVPARGEEEPATTAAADTTSPAGDSLYEPV